MSIRDSIFDFLQSSSIDLLLTLTKTISNLSQLLELRT